MPGFPGQNLIFTSLIIMYFSRAVIQPICLPPFDGDMGLDKGQAFHDVQCYTATKGPFIYYLSIFFWFGNKNGNFCSFFITYNMLTLTYLTNNRAADFILFWKFCFLHNLNRTYTFIDIDNFSSQNVILHT